MAEYKLTTSVDYLTGLPSMILRKADAVLIPPDTTNPDWLEYQAWLAAGGVPDPADVPIPSSRYDWGPTLAKIIRE
jgi:hypothetical protein